MDELPYTVDLWSEDELRIERDLARVADLTIARLVFDTAPLLYPDRMLTLRGPGVCEVHAALESGVARRIRANPIPLMGAA